MGKSTEPLKTRKYVTAETLTVVRLNPILCCHIPRNAPHFFVGPTFIPDNRCLTEWILSVKHRLLPDKLLILNNLSVKPHLFTDKLSILSQLFTVIRFHGGKQDSLTPQKAKHPCRLTEVSEAEQPHRPLRIVSLPRIIRLTQSSSTSHMSKGCTQMSLTAATRLPP